MNPISQRHPPHSLALAVLALCTASGVQAQATQPQADTPATPTLPAVVITSTRTQQPIDRTPASVSLVEGSAMREGRAQINLSEGLGGVPGLQVLNRNNYAQDLQLSIRGFGARSSFGVRGLRLYVDGIPATMPDGQGQTSNIDIASLERVEVLRGPFSALYGNSSGGVIQAFTAPGEGRPQVTASAAAGSDHTFRYGLQASGATGQDTGVTDYNVSASRFTTHGFREQSAARKNLANARLGITLAEDSQLTLVANSVDLTAQDPLGLTPSQYAQNWHDTAFVARQFNTRKTVRQTQVGAVWDKKINADNDLRLMVYGGQRDTVQYQSIAPLAAAQRANGGVIDLSRTYGGADLRWTHQRTLAARPLTLIAGLSYDQMREDRKGYNNYLGSAATPQALGVRGDLKRDERNDLWNLDPYVQASWQFAERWTLDAGLRHSSVHFKSTDHFLANGDDSGSAAYRRWLPMASISHALTPSTLLYASAGRGFETPTFNEISYRPDGTAGLNFALRPSTSTQYEIGAKTQLTGGLLAAALFQANTADEIVSAASIDGRSTFQNLGKTRRQGLEVGWSAELGHDLKVQTAYTWVDAVVRPAYRSGTTGKYIPGVARQALYASLDWAPAQGWRAGVDWRYLDKLYANSANTVSAPGYAVTGLYGGYKLAWRQWDWTAIARVDNLFDRRYVGSVIVNDTSNRYYEPAAGRSWLLSLSGTYHF
ncbi:MAG: Ferrichrome outer membrane transporter/phage receptor [Paracidovorax wautersii]|uniref:Ferrichrome outer membrane transporter/phage receptor n=1 Tax=Paracidovorax wautersii TaxID=1177982 RepID=A0A7V8FMV7_9BURK|nr:MAG: Ferrichrome outer membrane transporter/phage receptor [Paracidovorax wautersii]